MFQRIRGAIDARIAEEQARQRTSSDSLTRSDSTGWRTNDSSLSRQSSGRRLRRETSTSIASRQPDPSDFDTELAVGDDEEDNSTTGLNMEDQEKVAASGNSTATTGDTMGTPSRSSSLRDPPLKASQDLPTDARVKLRRLSKLEAKYQELLSAYRTAHTRNLTIEPFEATLRENTPLTSISDPRALAEYLNQISLKNDMVVEELKRMVQERDEYKTKLAAAEKFAQEARDEVASLKAANASSTGPGTNNDKNSTETGSVGGQKIVPSIQTTTTTNDVAAEAPQKSPGSSSISRAASIRGLFSPKSKAEDSPPAEESEEFFSFDSEIPRLESELKESQEEAEKLNFQVKRLTNDLSVARESTEGMAKSLEAATRELSALRESGDSQKVELKNRERKLASLESDLGSAKSQLEKSNAEVDSIRLQLSEKDSELSRAKEDAVKNERDTTDGKLEESEKRLGILQGLVNSLKSQLKDAESTVSSLKAEISTKTDEAGALQRVVAFVDDGLKNNDDWNTARSKLANGETPDFGVIRRSLAVSSPTESVVEPANLAATATLPNDANAGSKKKSNKKKKKGGKPISAATPTAPLEGSTQSSPTQNPDGSIKQLEAKILQLEADIAAKDGAIDRLQSKLKGEDVLREEIENLRDDLINLGQGHVEGKDKIKELLAEKAVLEKSHAELEKEITTLRSSSDTHAETEKAHTGLSADFEDLKVRAASLEKDLNVAQQLAATRFKDLTDLKQTLQKIQPELRNLRSESAELKNVKEELKSRASQVSTLERKYEDLRAEEKNLRFSIKEKHSEVKTLNSKISQETNNRLQSERTLEVAQMDLRYSEEKKQEVIEANQKTLRDLSRTQEDLQACRYKLREVEDQASQMNKDIRGLRDEIRLKTAQHASAQNLIGSMRDQTSEMAMQMKEATERCESLEEELSDAHRLLSERTREGETMRRLLSDVELKADIKVREFRERLESAIEERDRAEDEANSIGRRKARETEELKSKVHEAERALKRAEEDRDEVEHTQKEWKRRRAELESQAEQYGTELVDVKEAMAHLRDSLDESEKQIREIEKEKSELRRSVEETTQRLDKLKRSNKILTDDLKAFQTSTKKRGTDSGNRSPRLSIESNRNRAVRSPPLNNKNAVENGSLRSESSTGVLGTNEIDYVYLKNVLLQFLEQRDKNYQKQLVPVLGMMLHFDSSDEQKWISAISSR